MLSQATSDTRLDQLEKEIILLHSILESRPSQHEKINSITELDAKLSKFSGHGFANLIGSENRSSSIVWCLV